MCAREINASDDDIKANRSNAAVPSNRKNMHTHTHTHGLMQQHRERQAEHACFHSRFFPTQPISNLDGPKTNSAFVSNAVMHLVRRRMLNLYKMKDGRMFFWVFLFYSHIHFVMMTYSRFSRHENR